MAINEIMRRRDELERRITALNELLEALDQVIYRTDVLQEDWSTQLGEHLTRAGALATSKRELLCEEYRLVSKRAAEIEATCSCGHRWDLHVEGPCGPYNCTECDCKELPF